MYDDDTRLILEFQYRAINELIIILGRVPTREEVAEAVHEMIDAHSSENVVMM
jgi:hypothetical protein